MCDNPGAKAGARSQCQAQIGQYMAAQLSSGIAADQRALNFAGYLSTAIIALLGGAVLLRVQKSPEISEKIPLAVAIGLLVALALALFSARPVPFNYPGSGVKNGKIDYLIDESCYVNKINHNDRRLLCNGRIMLAAMAVTFVSLLGGAISIVQILSSTPS